MVEDGVFVRIGIARWKVVKVGASAGMLSLEASHAATSTIPTFGNDSVQDAESK